MKKLYSVVAATGLALAISGCSSNTPAEVPKENKANAIINEKTLCDIEANGIENVLATATKYNTIAIEHKVEFMKLGMRTSQYIEETQKALDVGSKEIFLLNKKGKATKNKVTVEYAAHRACKFAISALNQETVGKTTWRSAVPGDGFQY